MVNPMDVYNAIKRISPKAESDAKSFMDRLKGKYAPENPAPDEEIQKGLEDILAKHQPTELKAIHSPSKSTYSSGQMKAAAGLVVALTTLALAASGIPYVPYFPIY